MVSTPHGDVPRHIYEWRFPEKAHVKHAYPYVHHKTDKSGRLFYIDNAGMIDMKVRSDHAEITPRSRRDDAEMTPRYSPR